MHYTYSFEILPFYAFLNRQKHNSIFGTYKMSQVVFETYQKSHYVGWRHALLCYLISMLKILEHQVR